MVKSRLLLESLEKWAGEWWLCVERQKVSPWEDSQKSRVGGKSKYE